MLQAIERYMKQAIVDKVPSVSSSALVSSLVRIGSLASFSVNSSSIFFVFFTIHQIFVVFCLWWTLMSFLLQFLAYGEDELRCGEALGE